MKNGVFPICFQFLHSRQQAENMEQLTLDVYDLIPSKENFYSTENIDDLKQSISLVGILQRFWRQI